MMSAASVAWPTEGKRKWPGRRHEIGSYIRFLSASRGAAGALTVPGFGVGCQQNGIESDERGTDGVNRADDG
jgi:hypothetical protein